MQKYQIKVENRVDFQESVIHKIRMVTKQRIVRKGVLVLRENQKERLIMQQ